MPSEIEQIVSLMQADADCLVNPAQTIPTVSNPLEIPDDVAEFYSLCGGLELFPDADYSVTILPPDQVVASNPVIVGAQYPNDISSTWFLVASDGQGEYISVDFAPARLGRCYDSFTDTHAIAGSCALVAESFTSLLRQLYASHGQRWFWLEPGFVSLGDAYE